MTEQHQRDKRSHTSHSSDFVSVHFKSQPNPARTTYNRFYHGFGRPKMRLSAGWLIREMILPFIRRGDDCLHNRWNWNQTKMASKRPINFGGPITFTQDLQAELFKIGGSHQIRVNSRSSLGNLVKEILDESAFLVFEKARILKKSASWMILYLVCVWYLSIYTPCILMAYGIHG